eukprot:COSAG01_NODE_5627_length_4134_cov_3.733086_3_plen_68_part_00
MPQTALLLRASRISAPKQPLYRRRINNQQRILQTYFSGPLSHGPHNLAPLPCWPAPASAACTRTRRA